MNGRRVLGLTAFSAVTLAIASISTNSSTPPLLGDTDREDDGSFDAHAAQCLRCRTGVYDLCPVGGERFERELTAPTVRAPSPSQTAAMARTEARIAAGERGVPHEEVLAAHEALQAAESKRARKRAAWAARKEST